MKNNLNKFKKILNLNFEKIIVIFLKNNLNFVKYFNLFFENNLNLEKYKFFKINFFK